MRRIAPRHAFAAAAALALAALFGLAAASVLAQGSPQTPVRCEAPRTTGSSRTAGAGGLMMPVTLDQLTDQSSLVVSGTVSGFQSCARDAPDSITTRVFVTPERTFKGVPGKVVTLTVPGGVYGSYRLEVGTSPDFTAGERIVVFAGPEGTDLVPVEGFQGKLEVAPDGHVVRDGYTLAQLGAAISQAQRGTLSRSGDPLSGRTGFAESSFAPTGRSWPVTSLPVPVNFNVTDGRPAQLTAQNVRETMASAWHTWQNVDAAYVAIGRISETTRTSSQNGCDGLNDSTFGINAAHGSSTLAVTYTCFNGSTTLDTDVEIDVDHFGSSWRTNGLGNCDGYIDLETVLLHEYGHAIGLGHPSGNGGCGSCPVMDASYGSVQRTLCTDDQDGVIGLYPLAAGSPPAAPANLNANRNTTVTVTWNDVANELGYEIWRASETCSTAQSTDFGLRDTVDNDVLTYIDGNYGGGLEGATTYCYKLRSFNQSGTSAFSSTVQSDGSTGPTPSPSPTPTPTPTPTHTPTPSPSPTPTHTPTPTPSPSSSPSPTPIPTPTPTPGPTPSPGPTDNPTPSPANSPTPTPTAEPTPTPTVTPTPTATTPAPTPKPTDTPTPAPTVTAGMNGDVDCNGSIDAVDALYVLRSVAGFSGAPACMARGDTNCDGDIDATDALRILRDTAGIAPLRSTTAC